MEGHDLDEDGAHDEEGCYRCLLGREVKNDCRCGKCCRLLIEVLPQDAEREPRIKEVGSPLKGIDGELAGYLLNSKDNDHACAFLDRQTNLCAIHETRPLLCRLFDCGGEGRDQLIELGWIDRDG